MLVHVLSLLCRDTAMPTSASYQKSGHAIPHSAPRCDHLALLNNAMLIVCAGEGALQDILPWHVDDQAGDQGPDRFEAAQYECMQMGLPWLPHAWPCSLLCTLTAAASSSPMTVSASASSTTAMHSGGKPAPSNSSMMLRTTLDLNAHHILVSAMLKGDCTHLCCPCRLP